MERIKVTARYQPINAECNDLVPKFAKPGDSGMDLKSREEVYIHHGETKVVQTGMRIALPIGFELQVRSRSGLASKADIFVLNSPGTVDSSYRGEIGVIIHNISMDTGFKVRRGDRIAQGVVCVLPEVTIEVVSADDSLPDSERGSGGFGSTGV
jgi:dUTP pyrophosphatase